MGTIRTAAALLCLLAAMDAIAATVVDEGFTTGYTRRSRSLNRVSTATTADPVYHWMHLKDVPGKVSTRCIVTAPNGVPVVDESEMWEEEGDEGFLFCGVDGDEVELDPGTYKFTHYVNGQVLAERSIGVEKKSFWQGLSRYRQYKYLLGMLAVAIIGYFWVRKKFFGDTTFDEALADAKAGKPGKAGPVAIGSKVSGAQGVAAEAPAKPAEPTPLDLMEAFKAKLATDPQARPARAEDVIPIAKTARAAKDVKTTVAALRGFDKVYPGHALIPEVYMFSAKVMAEDVKNVEMARKVLEHLIAKHPGHWLAQEAKTYLKTLPQPA